MRACIIIVSKICSLMIDYKVKTIYVSTLGLDPFQCVEDVVSKWLKYYYNTFEADGKFY